MKKKIEETFISANNPYFNMLGNHNLGLWLIINPRIVRFFNLSKSDVAFSKLVIDFKFT